MIWDLYKVYWGIKTKEQLICVTRMTLGRALPRERKQNKVYRVWLKLTMQRNGSIWENQEDKCSQGFRDRPQIPLIRWSCYRRATTPNGSGDLKFTKRYALPTLLIEGILQYIHITNHHVAHLYIFNLIHQLCTNTLGIHI